MRKSNITPITHAWLKHINRDALPTAENPPEPGWFTRLLQSKDPQELEMANILCAVLEDVVIGKMYPELTRLLDEDEARAALLYLVDHNHIRFICDEEGDRVGIQLMQSGYDYCSSLLDLDDGSTKV